LAVRSDRRNRPTPFTFRSSSGRPALRHEG
jgi:hypothetical protein